MASERWARLCADVYCGLRRGAWYKVAFAGTKQIAVDVEGERVFLPRELLEVVDVRPALWNIVIHTRESFSFPPDQGKRYAVCPSCRERQVPTDRPWALRCQRCNGLFEVDWYQPIFANDAPYELFSNTG